MKVGSWWVRYLKRAKSIWWVEEESRWAALYGVMKSFSNENVGIVLQLCNITQRASVDLPTNPHRAGLEIIEQTDVAGWMCYVIVRFTFKTRLIRSVVQIFLITDLFLVEYAENMYDLAVIDLSVELQVVKLAALENVVLSSTHQTEMKKV